jgi:hypothetical protein
MKIQYLIICLLVALSINFSFSKDSTQIKHETKIEKLIIGTWVQNTDSNSKVTITSDSLFSYYDSHLISESVIEITYSDSLYLHFVSPNTYNLMYNNSGVPDVAIKVYESEEDKFPIIQYVLYIDEEFMELSVNSKVATFTKVE